ncbi:hypothetical protein BXZ70DRAFT_326759 [Cristinia sonorae]|uniref:F-box domain-containing protein n=1 Tax=Cristinia sonorae TaxID=1940300 RepID=A0A8K0UL80_9AGAR|nr:hypothetical protein BXZ70DRAFT_326759 [Cristinia sonorae]
MTTILDLPNELLEKILLQTDVKSIARCRRVSRSFDAIITESPEIQYKVELTLDGFVDNPSGQPQWSTRDRLDALRSRRSAWKSMQPTYRRSITSVKLVYPGSSGEYDLFRVATARHFVWFEENDDDCAHVLQIPSLSRGVPEKEWVVDLRGVPWRAADRLMAVESGEDLLVVVDTREKPTVILLSLTTGEYHLEAQEPNLPSVDDKPLLDARPEQLLVCGDYLCITVVDYYTEECDTRVYNWKTGKPLLFPSWPLLHTIAFTQDQYLLFAESKSPGTISVYRLPSSESPPHTTTTTAAPIIQLDLPPKFTLHTLTYPSRTSTHPDSEAASYFPHPGSRDDDEGNNRDAPVLLRLQMEHRYEADDTVYLRWETKRETFLLPWSIFLTAINTGQTRLSWEDWVPEDIRFRRRGCVPDDTRDVLWSVVGVGAYGGVLRCGVGGDGLEEARGRVEGALRLVAEEVQEGDSESRCRYEVLSLGEDCVVLSQVVCSFHEAPSFRVADCYHWFRLSCLSGI